MQRKLITKANISLPLPAPQILPLSLKRSEGLGQPQHVLEIFYSAQVPRESATNIPRRATLATTEVQHLPSFSSSCQELLFPSSSYSRLKVPLLPRSVMTFSSTVLPPLSTTSSSTIFLPLTKISSSPLLSYLNDHFLDCIALYRQSHTLILPSKIFSSLIPSSCASVFFSVFNYSPRITLNVWSRCLICSQPSSVMPSRSLYAFSWHIRCRTFHLRVFSNPVQCFSRFPIH